MPGPRAFAEIQFQIATSHSSHMTHMGHRAGEAVRGVAKQPYIEESRLLTTVGKMWRRGDHCVVDDTRSTHRGEMVAHHGGLKDALLMKCDPCLV